MSTPAPFFPSGLLDPRGAADFQQVLYTNFFIINSGPGFSRQPTRVNGAPNNIVGPPMAGTWYVDALWIDSLRSVWYCVATGAPGTWLQGSIPVVAATPTTTVVGYRITRSDLGYADYYWDGSSWVLISGGGGGGTVTGGQNLGTGADGEGVFTTVSGGNLLFRRIKPGANITVTSETNDLSVAVQTSPHFTGTTTIDVTKVPAVATPSPPGDDSFLVYTTSTGVSPNKQIVYKAKATDGTEVILCSIIV